MTMNRSRPKPRASPRATLRATPRPKLRGRVWVEIGSAAAMTEAGADLLEQIAACGSLSEAARRLRFSYRRAWMLVDAMNRRWPRPLVTTSVGGQRGGGARVTRLGEAVIRSYRDLQLQVEHVLDRATRAFDRATRADSH
jgi:molybdate transport system regulatory protein